jgi:hypothetical protein
MKNIISFSSVALLTILLGSSCQKMERPQLAANYPKDTNPPGGPLKFYTAYDGGDVDSIRANFGNKVGDATFVDGGISGKALNTGNNGYVKYGASNDFKASKSFAISFWMKKNGPNAAGVGTAFAFGLASSFDIWHKHDIFMLIEDAGQSTATDAAAKFHIRDQWFEFVGTKLMRNVLNNQWHHIVFSYSDATKTLTTYVDGAVPTNLPAGFGTYTSNGGNIDLSKTTGLVVGGPGHYAIGATPDAWMGTFKGQLDQFRLYGESLTAAEVTALYTGKK